MINNIEHHSTVYELDSDPSPYIRFYFYRDGGILINVDDMEESVSVALSPEKVTELKQILVMQHDAKN